MINRKLSFKLSSDVYNPGSFRYLKKIKIMKDDNIGVFSFCGVMTDMNPTSICIAFRGTESEFNDVLIDLMFCKKVIPYNIENKKIRVHSGFLLSYLAVRQTIHNYIKNNGTYKNIIVTGHSLGGAIATLCALDIKYNFPKKFVENYTFGAPRIGNKFFVDSYMKRLKDTTYRFVNGNDVVTNLPYKFLGFKHINKEIHIGKDKKWYKYLWGNCGNDHYLEEYEKGFKIIYE